MAHALEVAFDCDGERMKVDKQSEGVDKTTGSKFLEASVRIRKGQVLDTLEDFTCICRANSTQGEVESAPAVVNLACESLLLSYLLKMVYFLHHILHSQIKDKYAVILQMLSFDVLHTTPSPLTKFN